MIYQIGLTSGKSLQDCTQIKAIEILNDSAILPDNLDIGFPQDKEFLKGFIPLYTQGGIRYWGYL